MHAQELPNHFSLTTFLSPTAAQRYLNLPIYSKHKLSLITLTFDFTNVERTQYGKEDHNALEEGATQGAVCYESPGGTTLDVCPTA